MAKVFGTDGTPRGVGNQVSAEFNLVYRWHSATSKRDEEWTEKEYQRLFKKPSAEVSMAELMSGLALWDKTLPEDPMKRDFANLERGSDGKFSDDALVEILADSIEDTAGKGSPRNVWPTLIDRCFRGKQRAKGSPCRRDPGHAAVKKMGVGHVERVPQVLWPQASRDFRRDQQ